MRAPAAISGDFATYKHVQGRKMLQLVIEVPAEMASSVFAALGTPGSGEAIPVALARLKPTVSQPETVRTERTPFTELPMSQQAAMRCQEPDFWKFLESHSSRFWTEMIRKYGNEASAAAAIVRKRCGVESRAAIRAGHTSGDEWATFDAEYYAWQRGRR